MNDRHSLSQQFVGSWSDYGFITRARCQRQKTEQKFKIEVECV